MPQSLTPKIQKYIVKIMLKPIVKKLNVKQTIKNTKERFTNSRIT